MSKYARRGNSWEVIVLPSAGGILTALKSRLGIISTNDPSARLYSFPQCTHPSRPFCLYLIPRHVKKLTLLLYTSV